MAIGPVQLIVLGFNHPDFHGEIIGCCQVMTARPGNQSEVCDVRSTQGSAVRARMSRASVVTVGHSHGERTRWTTSARSEPGGNVAAWHPDYRASGR